MSKSDFPKHIGGKELKKHFNNGKLTRQEAIIAKCYDCMGRYDDGAADCGISECSLYPYMPYGSYEKKK